MRETMLWWLWFLSQYISPLLQPIILGITAGIVWWYTRETQKLRKQAQRQVEVAHQQTQEIQRQIEVQLRPCLVVTAASWHTQRALGMFSVENIGNGAAINILISRGESELRIPFLPRGERISVLVTSPTGDLRATYDVEDRYRGDYRLPIEDLDDAQLAVGVYLNIFYNNVEYDNRGSTVEQHQYRTNIQIRPSGVEILGSWKLSSDPYSSYDSPSSANY